MTDAKIDATRDYAMTIAHAIIDQVEQDSHDSGDLVGSEVIIWALLEVLATVINEFAADEAAKEACYATCLTFLTKQTTLN